MNRVCGLTRVMWTSSRPRRPARQRHRRAHAGVPGAEDEDLRHRGVLSIVCRLADHQTDAGAWFVTSAQGLISVRAPGNTREISSGGLRHGCGRRPCQPSSRIRLVRQAAKAVVSAAAAGVPDRLADPLYRHRCGVRLDDRRLRGSAPPDKARAYRNALALNLVLNGSWSWLFFNRRMLGASAIAAAALTASSADLTRRAAEVRPYPGRSHLRRIRCGVRSRRYCPPGSGS